MTSDGTVYVVDDDAGVRASARLLFESLGIDVRVYASAEEFLAAYTPSMTGCILLDLKMDGMSGLDLQERLRERDSSLGVVFLTAHGDVAAALRALRQGASHFLVKPAREQDLVDAVNRAMRQERADRGHARARVLLRTRLATLTPRESEVLDHVIAGRATKITAQALGISERTVEAHRARAFTKLHVRSVPELVRALDDLR